VKERHNTVLQIGILGVLGLAVILTAILPQVSADQRGQELLEISVILRASDSALWGNARLGMEQAANELGAELRFLTAQEDAEDQAALLAREVEGGADALVIVPADPTSLSGRLKELVGHRSVVSMESPVDGAVCTVTPDNRALGQALALAVLEDWTGGTVLLLDTAPSRTGISDRIEGAMETLEQAGVPVLRRILRADASADELVRLTSETRAVQMVAFEASATEQAAENKEARGLTPLLYGVGMTAQITAALERDTVSAVATWSDYAAGYLAVEAAIRAERKENGTQGPLSFFVVRGEDIYEPDNQKLLFPVVS
jgi:ABC-type sugar transport system substrate-binding protein